MNIRDLLGKAKAMSWEPSEGWTLGDALPFIRGLEKLTKEVGYHCALAGSIMYRGYSDKDLDIIVYPAKTEFLNESGLARAFVAAGLNFDRPTYKHARDTKDVRVYRYGNRRVDILRLS